MIFFEMISKIKFSNPKVNPIVIVYNNDYWIKKLILKDLSSTTLDVYPSELYITPLLMIRTFFRLRLMDWRKITKGAVLKELLKQIYDQYFLACIDQTKAKVVITSIDNSRFFQRLSQIDDKRAYFAIQNGTRTLSCVRDSLFSPAEPECLTTITVSNLFCFGQRDIDLYVKYGHKVDNFLPVGSLIGRYYKSVVSVPVTKPLFDLCLISQWHAHLFGEIVGSDFNAQTARRIGLSIMKMNLFLKRFINETGMSLIICTRNDDPEERKFHQELYGDDVSFAIADRKDFSTYRTAEQSRLVIGMNSTTLAEVFSWGHKVLWCNVPNDDHYEMPEAGISYFHGDDYSSFRERIFMILNMPQSEYEACTTKGAQYINNYDALNPPHESIRSVIKKSLLNAN
jgi:surface carbohydrate biosynthesis protein